MKSKSGLILLCCVFLGGYLCPLYAQEEPAEDVSTELWEFASELESESEGRQQQQQSKVEAKQEEVLLELEGEKSAAKTLATQQLVAQNANMMGSNPEEGAEEYLADRLLNHSAEHAEGKIGARQHEHEDLEEAIADLTSPSDSTLRSLVQEDVTLNLEDNLVSEFRLDYKVDKIEDYLDQKLDLTEGVMASDISALDINPDYGYGEQAWQNQNLAVQSQANRPANVRGVDFWHYDADEDRMKMVEQEAENLTLIGNDVVKRNERVNSLIESSSLIEQDGGIALSVDVVGEEKIKAKLLELDRKILDIMTEDAYEKDLAANGDSLVHEITGLPLKGYAKRKALKELDGPYGQVEQMRARNLGGEVLSENEIIDLMMNLYDGYNPY